MTTPHVPDTFLADLGAITNPLDRAKAAQEVFHRLRELAHEAYELRQRAVHTCYQHGMKQRALAEALNVSPSTLRKVLKFDYVNGGPS